MAGKAFVFNFDALSNSIRESINVLDFLQEKRDLLILVTNQKSDAFQSCILSVLKAGQRFIKVISLDKNKADIYIKTRERLNACGYSWHGVSNNFERDILSALAVGYTGVSISNEFRGESSVKSWLLISKMTRVRTPTGGCRCFFVKNLSEIKERYGEL